jgi:hypothetical protein
MPQTTPERRARWPGGDQGAIDHLKTQGYRLLKGWTWVKPSPAHEPTEREIDAIIYLIEEWDFGGLEGER